MLRVNFSITCMAVIGQNKESNIEVYLRGQIFKYLLDYQEYLAKFFKLNKDWAKEVVSISPQEKIIFFLLKNGIVKKLWKKGNELKEKDIGIEGYDDILNGLIIDDIGKIKFQSFLNENFIVFYQSM